jgi:hypothetical protein
MERTLNPLSTKPAATRSMGQVMAYAKQAAVDIADRPVAIDTMG